MTEQEPKWHRNSQVGGRNDCALQSGNGKIYHTLNNGEFVDMVADALNFALLREDIVRFIRGVVPLDTDDPQIKHDIIAKLEALDGK